MIDPFSAATLGGLAYDTAKTAITKWVGNRIAAGFSTALRERPLKQGRPAKDQQTELTAVITTGVQLTAAELFPDQDRLQRKFRKALLAGEPTDWPLVGGSDLTDLVADVHAWISRNDPQPGSSQNTNDPGVHPYLSVLCRNIIAQFGFRAENNGAKNTILYPRWSRFWTTELFTGLETTALPPSPVAAADVRNDFSASIGTVIQAQQVTFGSGPEASPTWPHRIGTVPPLAAAWQDRPVSAQLADALTEGGTAVVCQILSGMGGVGKTQTAAHYAQQRWNRHEVDLLLWVNASARESILAAFAQAGSELCGADAADSDAAARAFLDWLDGPDAPRWLIVLDDLTDPANLHSLWPPTSGHGRTIVTTRRRDAALETHARKRIDVDLFTPDQALAYLTDRLDGNPRLLTGAADLARDLGHLPLALAQAAAYILDQPGTTCTSYRDLLTDRTLTLDQLSPETLPEDYPRTVAAALQIAIEHADQYEPVGLASQLLALASLLDPAGIPADLFTTIQYTAQPDVGPIRHRSGGGSGPPPLPPRTVTDTLARLHRLNLIDHDGTTIRVHALIQRARRDQLDEHTIKSITTLDATALNRIWPGVENNPTYSALLRANVTRLREHADTALLHGDAHAVLFCQGKSLGENGLVTDAQHHFDHLRELCESSLGPDHLHTLLSRHQLAYWRGKTGDAAGAATELEALLDDYLRVLGPDHPHTLAARNNLADQRGEAGDAAGAATAIEELLTDILSVFGPDSFYTLSARHNLARWRGEAGDPAGAAAELEVLLTDRHRILGPDDPYTLNTRHNLAYWRGEAGDASGAVTALEAVLDDRLRVLGPDHPSTLITRNQLARWRGEAGAAEAAEAVLKDQLRVLGPDHPDTLTTRDDLSYWRAKAQNP